MGEGSTTALAAVLVALALGGCLEAPQAGSGPCVMLEDCLCGETVDAARGRCVAGENVAAFVLDDQLQEAQCEVVLHQLAEACPFGTLELRAPAPDPSALCVHDRDCAPACCRCGGAAAASVDLRRCEAGICVAAAVECNDRCLQARIVRGDPCEMLRSCRCAPLRYGAERFLDSDRNGLTDLQECEEEFSEADPEACLAAAKSVEGRAMAATACFETDGEREHGLSLPSSACPDWKGFVVAEP